MPLFFPVVTTHVELTFTGESVSESLLFSDCISGSLKGIYEEGGKRGKRDELERNIQESRKDREEG